LKEESIEISATQNLLYPLLAAVPVDALRLRFLVIREYNRQIQDVLPYIDMNMTDNKTTM
jgi:hypothetical protein